MPRADHYPPDIMDKALAFTDALNACLSLAEDWERNFSPNQAPQNPYGEIRRSYRETVNMKKEA